MFFPFFGLSSFLYFSMIRPVIVAPHSLQNIKYKMFLILSLILVFVFFGDWAGVGPCIYLSNDFSNFRR